VRQIFTIYFQALRQFFQNEGMVTSGHLAYLTMLGMFPFLIFFISLAALAGQTEAGIQTIGFFFDQLPEDIQKVLYNPINHLIDDSNRKILASSVIFAIWASSATIDAARVSIHRSFGMGEKPVFWRRRLEGVLLVILAGFAVLTGMTLFVLGPALWQALSPYVVIKSDWIAYFAWARIVLSLTLMFSALCAVNFALGPSGHRRKIRIMPGAITTLVLWTAMGAAFSTYLKYLGHYSNTYGSLAGPIIALLFFYAVNAAFLFGVEVNAAAVKSRDSAKTEAPKA
jgi:membrane protein